MKKIEILGLQTIPQIHTGDDLAGIIVRCAESEVAGLKDKDIIVITSKIVSKALGRVKKLSDVVPGKKASKISRKTGKDAKWLQMIFDEGHEILAILPLKGIIARHIMQTCRDSETAGELVEHEQAVCITRAPDGRICTCDAGIDGSNHPPGVVGLLPPDLDGQARLLRQRIEELSGRKLAVILADTEMVPFGTIDLATGSAGIEPVSKSFGEKDLFGRPKFGGMDLIAHELTAASTLLFGQTSAGIPVAVIRGCEYEISETASISNTLLLKPDSTDLAKAIKAAMRATAYTKRLKTRLLLKIASWFV